MASRPLRYGAPITLEEAKRVMAAAEAEANRNEWPMVIAITDNAGRLVMLHRLDDAQNGSIIIAQEKARTAVDFKRRPRRSRTPSPRAACICACSAPPMRCRWRAAFRSSAMERSSARSGLRHVVRPGRTGRRGGNSRALIKVRPRHTLPRAPTER